MDACVIDSERVAAQAGDFYGGWITSRIVGPFKGASRTSGWQHRPRRRGRRLRLQVSIFSSPIGVARIRMGPPLQKLALRKRIAAWRGIVAQ